MPRMSFGEAREFWNLSPDVRLAIATRAGFFRNDYEESVLIAEAHERAEEQERINREILETGLLLSDIY